MPQLQTLIGVDVGGTGIKAALVDVTTGVATGRIRVETPLSLEDARRLVAEFVAHYHDVRLHGAIGYVTPADKLAGREQSIFAERDRKLEAARERRRAAREASRSAV